MVGSEVELLKGINDSLFCNLLLHYKLKPE